VSLALRPVLGAVLGGVVAGCFAVFGVSSRGFLAAFLSVVLIAIAVIDAEKRIIPNVIVLPATLIVLVARIAIKPGRTIEWVVAAIAAGGFFLVAHLAYSEGLGAGDVKLAMLLGAAFGRYVVTALLLGLVAVALFGLVIIVREGAAGRKKALPFGPFLALGAIVAIFLHWP
jgi:leader peptidase (prepilin peptidase) / N-methyltransferase